MHFLHGGPDPVSLVRHFRRAYLPLRDRDAPDFSSFEKERTMSVYETHRTAGAGTLSGWIAGLGAAVVAWNDARVTRKALSRLSDRELDDIGLTRSDIDTIVWRG